ncbi:efflux RND transporter periplasmic adaptor subunit [Desulfovibrio inopinatus]|uniref:efflux RND transporter periplasmic adaptor subunit n=1 Tax=Desulfovibrio inopinatus TaxID=102109 RepID=UPI0006890E74|nr:efflux RND transporter periplasmic adaptor subunit [Desulfovibrio inopinatus]
MKHRSIISILASSLKIILPILVLAAGGAAAAYFQATKPITPKSRPQRQASVVDVMTALHGQATTTITGTGTIIPSREVVMRPEVSGTIQSISQEFNPGDQVQQGEVIVTLDPFDYEAEVKVKEGELDVAEADLAIENGHQSIVKDELSSLRRASSLTIHETSLILRKPNLKQVVAKVNMAKAELEKAKRDLERTKVKAPFTGIVISRDVAQGSRVSESDTLGTLVATDEYWIEAAIPMDKVVSLDLSSSEGAPAKVRTQTGEWQGRALRLTGNLSENTLMAKVLIAVKDPLGHDVNNGKPPLLLDDYATVTITGRSLENVVEIPRLALREDETVWILKDGQLDIRKVNTAWKNDKQVFIKGGLKEGETIVTSDLGAPVAGMALTTAEIVKASDSPTPQPTEDKEDS